MNPVPSISSDFRGLAEPDGADVAAILLRREEIQARVQALAAEIATCYGGNQDGLTIVPVLSGSIVFLADLIRELPLRMKIAMVHVSTYPGERVVAGEPRMVLQIVGDVRGRHVLVVDDIFDTGRTLRKVHATILQRQPASLRTAVLLRKRDKVPRDIRVDFVGFDIDDLFVVGYGLDYGDYYRNFPHIGVLRPELMP
jgi:hypoxanthine phosphoribosyltransferase